MREGRKHFLRWVKTLQQSGVNVQNTRAVVKSIVNARRSPIKTFVIRAGDRVRVVNGTGTGQEGTVKAVLRKKNQILVENVNRRRRTMKRPTLDGRVEIQTVIRELPIHYSNVQLLDPETGEPTRARMVRVNPRNQHHFPGKPLGRLRYSESSGAEIPIPRRPRREQKHVNAMTDTKAEDVITCTYQPPVYHRLRQRYEEEKRRQAQEEAGHELHSRV